MRSIFVYSALAAIMCFAHIKAHADADVDLSEENYNVTWIYFSNGSDLPEVAYLTEPSRARLFGMDDGGIEFELYTRKNEKSPIVVKFSQRKKRDIWSSVIKNFNPNLDTKIIVHGWKSSSRSDLIQGIKNEYLKKDEYNVLAVNWEEQAANTFYLLPVKYTRTVGRAIATLVDTLVEERNINPKRIHLIGHSLGAHTMGYAGSYSRYRVSRITGLDPAMPAFEFIAGPEGHLDQTDADFVDVIHTCAGVLGYSGPLGHVDFYPNSGKPPQPGCEGIENMAMACSHGRSYRFFAESINSEIGFHAYPCNDWSNFTDGKCQGDAVLMGDKTPTNVRGIYFLPTNAVSPFAFGQEIIGKKIKKKRL